MYPINNGGRQGEMEGQELSIRDEGWKGGSRGEGPDAVKHCSSVTEMRALLAPPSSDFGSGGG